MLPADRQQQLSKGSEECSGPCVTDQHDGVLKESSQGSRGLLVFSEQTCSLGPASLAGSNYSCLQELIVPSRSMAYVRDPCAP